MSEPNQLDESRPPMEPLSDTKIWQLIAWVLGIIGAIIAYLVGPKSDPKVKHWIKYSIAFFIVSIIAYIVAIVFSFIPFIGHLIYLLIMLVLVIVWLVGIVKILQGELWKPPYLNRIAEMLEI